MKKKAGYIFVAKFEQLIDLLNNGCLGVSIKNTYVWYLKVGRYLTMWFLK